MTTLAATVSRAADEVRAANHQTFRALLTAPEVYDVVGALDDLASRLPQLLGYLVRSLRAVPAVDYFDDRGVDPATALCHAHGELTDAGHELDELARRLRAAHNHLGHLGRHTTED